MFAFLRAINLAPQEWEELVQATGIASPFIGDVLQQALSRAQAVVVLLTPEEEAALSPDYYGHGDQPDDRGGWQARPNVLFEAGMALAALPDRTILVEIGAVRRFSDIAGRHSVRFDGDARSRHVLVGRLEAAGCDVRTHGRIDWLSAGDFSPSTHPAAPNQPQRGEGESDSVAPRVIQ
jgi:hypothetical protein